MRSAFYWGPTGLSMTENNPYGGLLARSMSKLGIELVSADREALNEEWVEENRGKIDVLHIHHPWYHYASEDLEEATALSDRISVLYRGRVVGEQVRGGFCVEALGRMMTTGKEMSLNPTDG